MERIYTTGATRKPKWKYSLAAAPTPMILHLPRRPGTRRKSTKASQVGRTSCQKDKKGRLEALFDQERSFDWSPVPVVVVSSGIDGEEKKERRRERVKQEEERAEVEEEKWRFQAEMLRAECNLLRMEKEIAVKKMERRRQHMERTLNSAIHTLLSGWKQISEGKNVSLVLEQEINFLVGKLQELQRNLKFKDLEVKNCSNFDRQASVLRRRLEKFDGISDKICVEEIREMAEASLSIKPSNQADETIVSNSNSNMDILRRKIEALSKGLLLERTKKECGSIISTPNSLASSLASSSKRIQLLDIPTQKLYKETKAHEEQACSGCCKAIVRRVVEQVRVETEQWSQMQEMLNQVSDEMEDLQASRDFWEGRALTCDSQIQSVRSTVQEWINKALSSEAKAKDLEAQVCILRGELERLRMDKTPEGKSNNLPTEKEKRVLICRLKENHHAKDDNRSKQKEPLSLRRKKTQMAQSRRLIAPTLSPLQDVRNHPLVMRERVNLMLGSQNTPDKENL